MEFSFPLLYFAFFLFNSKKKFMKYARLSNEPENFNFPSNKPFLSFLAKQLNIPFKLPLLALIFKYLQHKKYMKGNCLICLELAEMFI